MRIQGGLFYASTREEKSRRGSDVGTRTAEVDWECAMIRRRHDWAFLWRSIALGAFRTKCAASVNHAICNLRRTKSLVYRQFGDTSGLGDVSGLHKQTSAFLHAFSTLSPRPQMLFSAHAISPLFNLRHLYNMSSPTATGLEAAGSPLYYHGTHATQRQRSICRLSMIIPTNWALLCFLF